MGTFWVGSRSNIICFTDPDPRLASDKDLDNDVDQDEDSIVLYYQHMHPVGENIIPYDTLYLMYRFEKYLKISLNIHC